MKGKERTKKVVNQLGSKKNCRQRPTPVRRLSVQDEKAGVAVPRRERSILCWRNGGIRRPVPGRDELRAALGG